MAARAGSNQIFISYRREDASWPARWLADRLARQFGPGVVFQDVDSIRLGDDFAAKIEEAVSSCLVLLAVIGPHWSGRQSSTRLRLDDPEDWVRLEIEAAIRRGIRIIPILADRAEMPSEEKLPVSLRVLAAKQALILDPSSLSIDPLVAELKTAIAQDRRSQNYVRVGTPEAASSSQLGSNELLLSAIQTVFALEEKNAKIELLVDIIRAAALTAPERLRWLTDEAESVARSIENSASRAWALRTVAEAVAVTDPERGETIARSIEDHGDQVLAALARAVALTDLKHAVAIAGSIEDRQTYAFALTDLLIAGAATDPGQAEAIAGRFPKGNYFKAKALAGIALQAATADPERAVNIARSIDSGHTDEYALVEVAEVVAATDPTRAETIARSIDTPSTRAFALFLVAGAVAASDPMHARWLAVEVEAIFRAAGEPAARGRVPPTLIEAVAMSGPGRAETMARSMDSSSKQMESLGKVAVVVARSDPERAENIARSINPPLLQLDILLDVAEVMADLNPRRAEAIAGSIGDAALRGLAVSMVAQMVAKTDVKQAAAIAARIENESAKARTLAHIVSIAAQPGRYKGRTPSSNFEGYWIQFPSH